MAFYLAEEEPRLRRRLADLMGDLEPEGMPFDRSATSPASLSIPLRRGQCYGITFRGSYDLDGSLNPEAAVEAKFIGSGGYWAPVYNEIYAVTPFCPQESGRIVVRVKPEKATKGSWRVQLFSAPIADAKLRKQMEEYETELRIRMVRTVCGNCARGQVGCLLAGEPQCLAKYLNCLGQMGLTPADCERGDVPPAPPPKPPKEARIEWPLDARDAEVCIAAPDVSGFF
jgi:hypothetical protein